MKKKIVHTCEITSYSSEKELSEDLQILLKKAREALKSSYSPYSGFQVGAALKLSTGEIVLGSNQENAAYPSGLCAERVAFFAIGAAGKAGLIRTVAIRARTDSRTVKRPPTSCGDCRQVMLEFEGQAGQPITVLCQGEEGAVLRVEGIAGGLIPFPFEFED